MREGPTVTDSRSWHRLICSLCPLCPGHDTKLHPRRGPKWASRAYQMLSLIHISEPTRPY